MDGKPNVILGSFICIVKRGHSWYNGEFNDRTINYLNMAPSHNVNGWLLHST